MCTSYTKHADGSCNTKSTHTLTQEPSGQGLGAVRWDEVQKIVHEDFSPPACVVSNPPSGRSLCPLAAWLHLSFSSLALYFSPNDSSGIGFLWFWFDRCSCCGTSRVAFVLGLSAEIKFELCYGFGFNRCFKCALTFCDVRIRAILRSWQDVVHFLHSPC